MPDDRIATVRPIEESEATEKVAAIFADIKAHQEPRIRAGLLAGHRDQPAQLELVWSTLKTLMHPESVGRAARLDPEDSRDHRSGGLGDQRMPVLHQLAHHGPAQTGSGRGGASARSWRSSACST